MPDEFLAWLDRDTSMLADPVTYNDAVVRYFRTTYAEHLVRVFSELESRAASPYAPWLQRALAVVPRRALERHLFALFSAATSSGGVTEQHIRFGSAFLRGISIPVMQIDHMLDRLHLAAGTESEATGLTSPIWLGSICLLHEGLRDMLNLPHAKELLKVVLSDYLRVYSSLETEMKGRYKDYGLLHPTEYLNWMLHSYDSSLTCRYFSVTVQGAILINQGAVSPTVKKLAHLFGRLRQLVDQIADVEEDVLIGKLTVPVLHALTKCPLLQEEIRDLWRESQGCSLDTELLQPRLNRIHKLVLENNGFEYSSGLALSCYEEAMALFHNEPLLPDLGIEIRILFRLKRAFLERLKRNGWRDIPGYY